MLLISIAIISVVRIINIHIAIMVGVVGRKWNIQRGLFGEVPLPEGSIYSLFSIRE